MKYKLINYHCRHCGAPVEPGKERCSYCEQIARYQKFVGGKGKLLTLLVDTDNDFVNFNEITNISSTSDYSDTIDCTMLGDSRGRYILGRDFNTGRIELDMPFTERGHELIQKLKPRVYRMKFEINGTKIAYETKAYIGEIQTEWSNSDVRTAHITLIRDDDMKYSELEQPKGLTCPNCDAPIISRYGACGYCGGWLEYVS